VISPNQDGSFGGEGSGVIKAIGSPLQVTKMGFPVCLTLESSERHVALKLDTGIISIAIPPSGDILP